MHLIITCIRDETCIQSFMLRNRSMCVGCQLYFLLLIISLMDPITRSRVCWKLRRNLINNSRNICYRTIFDKNGFSRLTKPIFVKVKTESKRGRFVRDRATRDWINSQKTVLVHSAFLMRIGISCTRGQVNREYRIEYRVSYSWLTLYPAISNRVVTLARSRMTSNRRGELSTRR